MLCRRQFLLEPSLSSNLDFRKRRKTRMERKMKKKERRRGRKRRKKERNIR
jgi:hypothetical protein